VKRFEASLYNRWVRLLLDSGEANVTGFSDSWADIHYIEVEADSIVKAGRQLSRDYPDEVGFVILGIEEI
jgi:hypothetical protein